MYPDENPSRLFNQGVTGSSIFIAAQVWRKFAEMSEKSKCQTVPLAVDRLKVHIQK